MDAGTKNEKISRRNTNEMLDIDKKDNEKCSAMSESVYMLLKGTTEGWRLRGGGGERVGGSERG